MQPSREPLKEYLVVYTTRGVADEVQGAIVKSASREGVRTAFAQWWAEYIEPRVQLNEIVSISEVR